MALTAGTRLGPYEILAPIGAGGMGEVYKARDTRLDRIVALKVSKGEWSERFEREARAVAALNHASICQLYDVGPNFLVMEYIEGAPLKGPLPVDQALKYAAEICDALDVAHRKGIIHRDLKPANILVTKTGIKLLDFGLAKIAQAAKPPGDATLTMALTDKNEIVGTLYYMSPEQLEAQASGQEIDWRTDIFSFGLVLYEILIGKRAFDGSSPASVIAAIMERPAPSIAEIASPALDRVLQRCLEKDPDERWQSASDLSHELKWIADGGPQTGAAFAMAQPHKSRANFGWIVAGVLAVALAAVGALALRRVPETAAPLMRLQLPLPPAVVWNEISFPVVSPDGSRVAFSAIDLKQHKTLLFIRALDSTAAQPVSGTEDANSPFWSPDSKQVAFFSQGKLKRVEIAGGAPQIICDTPGLTVAARGSWNAEGKIFFTMRGAGLKQVSAHGGEVTNAAQLDAAREETGFSPPQSLPDGKQVLFHVSSARPEYAGAYVGTFGARGRTRVLTADMSPIFTPPGYLLYTSGATLVAQRFDLQPRRLQGEPVSLAPRVWTPPLIVGRYAGFSVSESGLVAYRSVDEEITPLVWFDRQGRRLGTVGEPGNYTNPAISPDGKRLAVGRADPSTGKRDIWLIDLERGGSGRFTFDPSDDMNPAWSPDGSRIAFSSDRKGTRDIYLKSSNGAGEEELLLESGLNKSVLDWSADGRTLAYSGAGIWGLTLAPERKTAVIVDERGADQISFSPDGKWMAYRSFDSGVSEIYARPFSGGAGKWQISTSGGSDPYWARDGKEVFYMKENSFMAVKIRASASGLEPGKPVKLFEAPVRPERRNRFVASPDGQRFLIATTSEQASSAPIEVLLNWQAQLR
jgi:Tol biopolymer transport system component/predicted Ser/Thr protein kinase